MERFPRSLIRRIEKTELPLSALGAVRELRVYLDAVERESIVRARTLGASPTEIARELGITRQAVHKKLRVLLKVDEPTIVLPEADEDVDVDRTDA